MTMSAERVNHGHDRWTGERFVADYQTWCPACRAAKAAAPARCPLHGPTCKMGARHDQRVAEAARANAR